jgi:hypothetical protein
VYESFFRRPVFLQTIYRFLSSSAVTNIESYEYFFQSEKYFKYSSSGSICNNNCCMCENYVGLMINVQPSVYCMLNC